MLWFGSFADQFVEGFAAEELREHRAQLAMAQGFTRMKVSERADDASGDL